MLLNLMVDTLHLLDMPDRNAWRMWLQNNHAHEACVWLVSWKVSSGKRTLTYDKAVEEALCFGWIDSTVRRLDERRFARKFTPRRNAANWSAPNLKRFEKVKAAGLMTEAGLRVFAPELRKRAVAPAKVNAAIPHDLGTALSRNKKARGFFSTLAPSYRNQYIGWIEAAKRVETRARRITEAVGRLAAGQKLGLK